MVFLLLIGLVSAAAVFLAPDDTHETELAAPPAAGNTAGPGIVPAAMASGDALAGIGRIDLETIVLVAAGNLDNRFSVNTDEVTSDQTARQPEVRLSVAPAVGRTSPPYVAMDTVLRSYLQSSHTFAAPANASVGAPAAAAAAAAARRMRHIARN